MEVLKDVDAGPKRDRRPDRDRSPEEHAGRSENERHRHDKERRAEAKPPQQPPRDHELDHEAGESSVEVEIAEERRERILLRTMKNFASALNCQPARLVVTLATRMSTAIERR